MKVKVLQNRQIILETNDAGTQFENLATTLNFEFPEYVEKNGVEIPTSNLNKYITFDLKNDYYTDLIVDDDYVIPQEVTQYPKVIAFIQLKEPTLNDVMTDKLIWISDGFLLTFDEATDTNIEVTAEKIDAFNTLYTELNLKIIEVNDLKDYIEQFKLDVEAGKYDGKDGYTPIKGVDYFTPAEINEIKQEIITEVFQSASFTNLQSAVADIQNQLNTNDILIIEKGD